MNTEHARHRSGTQVQHARTGDTQRHLTNGTSLALAAAQLVAFLLARSNVVLDLGDRAAHLVRVARQRIGGNTARHMQTIPRHTKEEPMQQRRGTQSDVPSTRSIPDARVLALVRVAECCMQAQLH